MPTNKYIRPTVSAAPAMPPQLMPQPPIAPLVPPAHVVDLMTVDGSAAFGARWRATEAKIVECPALTRFHARIQDDLRRRSACRTARLRRYGMAEVAATDLGARRGGGMVSFFWFRATLIIPARAGGFDTAGAKTVLTVNVDDYAEVWVNGECRARPGGPARPRSRASTCPIGSCFAIPLRRAIHSRLRFSPSTDRSRPRRQISCGFARPRSSSIAEAVRACTGLRSLHSGRRILIAGKDRGTRNHQRAA